MRRIKAFSVLIMGLFLASGSVLSADITIYHTNDLHANVLPFKAPYVSKDKKVGGFANIASIVKQAKAKDDGVFLFDAGDFFTGPYISTLTQGEAIIDIMNQMSFDAVSIGNHEFDHGVPNMIEQLSKATFPVLLGNLFYENSDKPVWDKPWVILEKAGIKVGVIGLHGKFAFYDTVNKNMRAGVEMRDEVEYLNKYLGQIRDKVDVTVLLIHEGVPARQSSFGSADVTRLLSKDIELAKQVQGLDVLITGHAHVGTPEPIKVNNTLIVSTDAYGIDLGKLVLNIDDKTKKIAGYQGKLINIYDGDVEPDPATAAKVALWTDKLKQITQQKIGSASAELTRSYGESSAAGNMVGDAFLAAEPRAQLAFVNSGGLRSELAQGEIKLGDIITMFPFPDDLSYMEINGKQLRWLMNHAANLTNGILQVSKGIEMEYDSRKPLNQRIVSLTVQGQPLKDDAWYPIVVNSFLATGGDGFSAFTEGRNIRTLPGSGATAAVVDYIKSQPEIVPDEHKRIKDQAL
ncbi:Trifunctional nucleotide phosphoesterase protein YfkN precursor [Serratia odorifera]|jgi:2',3'-cyclic-nucleotide 2'-phosphodiesterase (5'-nucleotidase family)|nr:bifunctional metallophosphatase/5'-nucleotidase [Serratia odorifera]RII73461.1 bifunctional metallophosphatase/5'-nucleotidase [Serratia odorifera]VDZ52907.1 Trifunctional nucleotide phosphoesterase protein YfkN precursor [Serratia odorifera]